MIKCMLYERNLFTEHGFKLLRVVGIINMYIVSKRYIGNFPQYSNNHNHCSPPCKQLSLG